MRYGMEDKTHHTSSENSLNVHRRSKKQQRSTKLQKNLSIVLDVNAFIAL